jgi:hypothetical protein
MSPITPVGRARAALLATVAGAALAWAALLGAGVILSAALADLLLPLPLGVGRLAVPTGIIGALVAAVLVLWRGRHARSLWRVALYLEERLPELQFALVTAVDPAEAPTAERARTLERAVGRVDRRGVLRAPITRAIAVPALGLIIALLGLGLLPLGTLERVVRPRAGDLLLRPPARTRLGSRLASIAVWVEPPRYTGRGPRTLDDPTSVSAPVGSRIVVRGRGAAALPRDRIGAELGSGSEVRGRSLPIAVAGDTWSASVSIPAAPTALRLIDRSFDRLLILQPLPDDPPTVTLTAPARDTVYREAKGRLTLAAEVRDDIGLDRAEIEVMHTSGSGERFQTTRRVVVRVALGGARSAAVRSAILLDTLALRPGDVLHIRAIAWDRNDIAGPGRGESETRTIRILDPRDRAFMNVTPAKAAAIDTSILSQRMLIIRAESLLAQRSRLGAQQFTSRSLSLSVRQGQLRGRVESIVFDLENVEGVGFVGETPSSRILRLASAAMLGAQTELSIAQVAVALPHMRRALKYLEQVRDANRYWLRGLLTTRPIDIDRVRLIGTGRVSVAGRTPRRPELDVRGALCARIDAALAMLDRDPAAARESLELLLVDALTQAKGAAELLGRAVDALHDRHDPRSLLVQARRLLEPGAAARGTLSPWLGMP